MNTTVVSSPNHNRSSLYELSMASSKELLRNGKTIFSLLFMFFFFLIVMAGINVFVNGNRAAPVVGVVGSTEHGHALVSKLTGEGVKASIIEPGDAAPEVTARVTIENQSASVVLSTPKSPSWIDLSRTIHSLGIPSTQINVVDSAGGPEFDILRMNLATVLVAGFMAIAFMGTSVPLVALRQRGTLRLLGTTPVRRFTFIVSQSPIRFLLGVAEAAVIVAIAWTQGYVESLSVVRLAITLLLGLGMLFAFAYLLASRARNADLITQITGFIPVIVIFMSGTVFPLDGLPEAFRFATWCVPSTWFMQAASADIAGTEPFMSVYALWALMAGVGAGVAFLAAKLFTWDQGDR